MELETFGRLLVIQGADLSRWPEADRHEAELLLAWSSEAKRLRDEAARIDHALRQAGSTVSAEAVERVLARIEAAADGAARAEDDAFAILPRAMRAPWIAAAMMATMVVIGFLLGGVTAPTESRQASDIVDLLASRTLGFDL